MTVDDDDDLDDEERTRLHAALERSLQDVEAGRVHDAADVIDELRARHHQIVELELALLRREVRSDRTSVDALLDPDFREIGKSGRMWSRSEMLDALAKEASSAGDEIEASEIESAALGPTLILVTYVSMVSGHRSRRSSLWRRTATGWRIVFHQGTPISA